MHNNLRQYYATVMIYLSISFERMQDIKYNLHQALKKRINVLLSDNNRYCDKCEDSLTSDMYHMIFL